MHILIDLLVRNRRLVGRMYGYGCALICLLETSTDPPAPRGWPLGLALLAITAVATDHDGVRARWCLLHTRPGRVLFYAVLGLIVTLTAMALAPAQH